MTLFGVFSALRMILNVNKVEKILMMLLTVMLLPKLHRVPTRPPSFLKLSIRLPKPAGLLLLKTFCQPLTVYSMFCKLQVLKIF